jgi:hypothetical protein
LNLFRQKFFDSPGGHLAILNRLNDQGRATNDITAGK